MNGSAIIVKTTSVKSTGDEQIDHQIAALKRSMEDYMKDADPSYAQKDIEECTSLLSGCTEGILSSNSKNEAMSIVKSTVLKLNVLNEDCDFSLIETDQREQIAEIIILTGYKMKYNSMDEDITEEWREW